MSEKIVSLSVDSFPNHFTEGYEGLSELLHTDVAQRYVSSLHYPADLFLNYHRIEPLVQLVAGAPGAIEKFPVIADVSFSGGYISARRQMDYIMRNYRTSMMTFIISRGMTNSGIENLVRPYEGDETVEFLLEGVLPEDMPADIKSSFDCSPNQLTKRAIRRAHKLGLTGIYGSAIYAHMERGTLKYTGAGISYDGNPYESDGILKLSTKLNIAVPLCDQINVGHLVVAHPNGFEAGLVELGKGISQSIS